MRRSTINRTQRRRFGIILLAYLHRYAYPLLAVILPLLTQSKMNAVLYMGIAFILLALYDFLGFKFRWIHIFCSYQNAYHKRMTPDHINWNSIKKSDAYGIPLLMVGLGMTMIILYLCSI